MKESVLSFDEKKHNLGFPSFKLPAILKFFFKTNPLNIIFYDFSI